MTKRVRMVIVQPRLKHVSEHAMTVEALDTFVMGTLAPAAARTRTSPEYKPSADNCHFCKASGDCTPQTQFVLKHAIVGFDFQPPVVTKEVPPAERGLVYESLGLIEAWCKKQRELVKEDLIAGRPVIGKHGPYKLVEGGGGARRWDDEDAAAQFMTEWLGVPEDKVYSRSAISPTQAEKILKQDPVAWEALQDRIKRSPMAPVIAPASSNKPALRTSTGFEFQESPRG